MTYILSNERDDNVALSFENYRDYLLSNRDKLSDSVYKLATSDWWYDFKDHKCPHDAWLERVLIIEPSEGKRNENRTTKVKIMLLSAYQDGYIELSYKNAVSIKIDSHNVKLGHKDCYYTCDMMNLDIHSQGYSFMKLNGVAVKKQQIGKLKQKILNIAGMTNDRNLLLQFLHFHHPWWSKAIIYVLIYEPILKLSHSRHTPYISSFRTGLL